MMEISKQNERFKSADDALAKADVQALKNLHEQAEEDLITMVGALSAMSRADQLSPRPSNSSINAMRDVALAAIDLAKNVIKQKYNQCIQGTRDKAPRP